MRWNRGSTLGNPLLQWKALLGTPFRRTEEVPEPMIVLIHLIHLSLKPFALRTQYITSRSILSKAFSKFIFSIIISFVDLWQICRYSKAEAIILDGSGFQKAILVGMDRGNDLLQHVCQQLGYKLDATIEQGHWLEVYQFCRVIHFWNPLILLAHIFPSYNLRHISQKSFFRAGQYVFMNSLLKSCSHMMIYQLARSG